MLLKISLVVMNEFWVSTLILEIGLNQLPLMTSNDVNIFHPKILNKN